MDQHEVESCHVDESNTICNGDNLNKTELPASKNCWEHLNIDTDWGTIRGKKIGNGKRNVLATHGWLDNANSFDLIAPYISDDTTIISIDLPGHGWSDHFPPGFIYDKRGYVGAIKKVVNSIGWTKFTYLGHSMGAVVGILYCAVFPEDVNTFISIDIIKPWSVKPKDYASVLRKNILSYFKNEELSKQSPLEYGEQELMARTIEGPGNSLDEKAARILMERSTKITSSGKKRILSRDLRAKAYFIGFFTFEAWYEFAKSITCPILIIKGKNGHSYESENDYKIMLDAYKDGCKLFRYIEMEGKHHIHLTNSSEVGPIMKKFMDDTNSIVNENFNGLPIY